MANKQKSKSSSDRTVYREFGSTDAAFDRPSTPDLPPNQQDLRIQASRKGRGGKTVTVISGFQTNADTLKALLKTLKGQCGSGGTVKDQTLEIQGDHRETLRDSLLKLGYRAKISGG
ncbi:MAG: translation initiation factor [Prochlorothrix sp.]|nr:translation initiation factor [Prochlorothrix sp.]